MIIDLSWLCVHTIYTVYIYMVGGFNPSEKILVSWGYYSQYMGKKHVANHQPDIYLGKLSYFINLK